MGKYKDEYDDLEHDGKEDHKEEHDDDDIGLPPGPSLDVVVSPVTTVVNNIVNVVVSPPQVAVNNSVVVVVDKQINNSIPAPEPAPKPDPVPQTPNYIYGSSKKNYLVGTALNDVIYGYQENDTLIDGTGADKLYGGKGKNIYRCSADGQVDFVYVNKDKQPDIIQFMGLEDRIDIRGSKFTFQATSRGIEIFSKYGLQAIYTGNNLSIEQVQAATI
jgi:hypothetical protein